jgi:hypothetical protein
VPGTLSDVAVIAAGGDLSMAIAPDQPPTAIGQSVSGQGSQDVIIQLSGSDLADSPLNFQILSLPIYGNLYQYDDSQDNLRGAPILQTNTTVTDGDGFVIYAPATNGLDSFNFAASNGITNSPPATVTVEVADQPPVADAQSVSTNWNNDLLIQLSGSDPDGDPLDFRILSLPVSGSLYQYGCGNATSGAAIVATNTVVTDPAGQIIFAPATNGFGNPYTSFDFVANDGMLDSPPATVTVTISTPSIPQASVTWNYADDGSLYGFELDFCGDDWATYSVWGSTNLVDWKQLGSATFNEGGYFQFIDTDATNQSQRFYRISAP